MHHLGSEFIGADDQPLMFKFTPWGKRTLDTLTSETGSFDIDISNTSLSCQQQCFQPRQRTFQWGTRHAKEEVPCAPLRIQQGTSNLAGSNISPASCQTSLLKLGWGRPLIQLESNVPMGLSVRSNSSNVLASPYKSTNHSSLQRVRMGGPSGQLPPVPKAFITIDEILQGTSKSQTRPLINVYQMLVEDETDHALRPTDPTQLRAYARAAQHAMRHAAPKNTQGANRTGWHLWESFLLEIGGPNTPSPSLRQPDPSGHLRERLLKAMFLLWCRTKCKSTIPGRVDVKPSTLLGHLYAVKRVHEANGLEFLTRGQSSQVINALTHEYELIHIHGPEALMPQKREGFTPRMVRRLLRSVVGLELRTRKHPTIVARSWLAYNIKGAISLAGNAGFRQSEITTMEHAEFTAMQMSRASVASLISFAL